MIDATDLTKSYGPIEALRGVSFHIAPGEIVGMLGPNGAGKTTTIKILTGYLHPDEGTVVVNGLDVLAHTREVQAQIGYLPESAPLYPELSVQAYLGRREGIGRLDGGATRPHLGGGLCHRIGRSSGSSHRPAEQGVSPASRTGPGNPAQAPAFDSGRANHWTGSHSDRGDTAPDPPSG